MLFGGDNHDIGDQDAGLRRNSRPSSGRERLTPIDSFEAPRPKTDAEIVKGIVEGEPWASSALYERTFAVVLSSVQRALGGRADEQDDLIQLAFERLVRSLKKGRFEGRAALTSWASIIADRVAIDSIRRRVKDRKVHWWLAPESPELVEYPAPQALEKRIEWRAEVMQMMLALTRMKPEYAQAVELHDFQGLELHEVAAAIGVSPAAAQSRLIRGRRELGRAMKFRYRKPVD